jgi:hypothetical protein
VTVDSRRVADGIGFARVVRVPSLTLSRAVAVLRGVSLAELEHPKLAPEVAHVLMPLLEEYGFDLRRPIKVHQLRDGQGFHLTQ